MEYEYIWDEKKRQSNMRKHRFDFKRAREVFNDPNGLVIYDGSHASEERFLFVGVLDTVLVTVVVFTETDYIAVRRIISFRKASKEEREQYHGRR